MKIARKLPNGLTTGIYVDGYLHELLEGFRNAVEKHNTSVVIVVDGRSGMGKTTLANQIGIILDPNFDLPKLYYDPETFLDGLATAKKGDVFLFDEAMLISSRSALTEINRMIVQAMSMIRSKNIYVIFCVNSIFDLDKNLAISRADILLHVYGESLIDRGRFAAFFRAKDGLDRLKQLYLKGKKLYEYTEPKANFIGSFTKNFVVDEQEYEKRKQEGINRFLKSSTIKIKAFRSRDMLIKHILDNKLMKIDDVVRVTDISIRQIYTIWGKNQGIPRE